MASHPYAPSRFLDLSRTIHGGLFEESEPVWEALKKIEGYLEAALKPEMRGEVRGSAFLGDEVFIGDGTVIEHGAVVKGPAWIGANCVVRGGAYVRENVVVGDGVVLGNSCEFKNCVLFDGCEVPHFNYVGDSLLGWKAHLGAGVILSNVRLDRAHILLREPGSGEEIATGLRKFGAVVGDRTEVGCNSVLSPGAMIGRDCVLYPGCQWKGILDAERVVKVRQSQEIVERLSS